MSVPGPVLGPCESWIDGADVAACGACALNEGSDTSSLDQVAIDASVVLYEISGRLFTGLCDHVVRPCRSGCSCWGSESLGLGAWGWGWASGADPGGYWGWRNECGDRCGCGSLSKVKLGGYPVREIVAVTIGGEVLDPLDDDGNPNYRLDGRRWLVRMDSPTGGKRLWPSCQNLALDSSEGGTFEVTYRSGIDPPEIGRRAAAELACQLAIACGLAGGDCLLPQGTTRITRQGVTVERELLTGWFDSTKTTGLPAVDLFLRGFWTNRRGRRPAVYSPDVQPFAREVG